MSGWTITRSDGGGHQVIRMDGDSGEETLEGTFGPEVPADDIIEAVLNAGAVADWIIGPDGEPMIIGEEPQPPPE